MTKLAYKTICFSGHRPEKLPFKGDDLSPVTGAIKSILYKEITECIESGYNRFITGLARGVDNWAADIVIDFKSRGYDIFLLCVLPYRTYGSEWRGFDKWNLSHILEKADETVTICDEYNKDCMRLRNNYMVDNSEKLIAVVSNYKSGTGQTIRYAQKKALDVKIIDLNNIF